jgi:hypothetical protein
MNRQYESNYYLASTPAILRKIKIFEFPLKGVLQKQYSKEECKEILNLSREEFKKLIPDLPYIGGKANPLTSNLIYTAWALSVYRTLVSRGSSVEDAGMIIYTAVEKLLALVPKGLIKHFVRKKYTDKFTARLKGLSLISKKRTYAGDWVFDVLGYEDQDFDLGVDYTECGICKYLKKNNAFELAPYICKVDYAVCNAFGLELYRTKTLANGDQVCNFRFKKL